MTKQKEKKKASIVKKMMIAVVAGFVVGFICLLIKSAVMGTDGEGAWKVVEAILFQDITATKDIEGLGLFYIVGQLFMKGLQMMIVPLVLCSLTLALCSLANPKKLGRIAGKTFVSYLCFYIVAAALAGAAAYLAKSLGLVHSQSSGTTGSGHRYNGGLQPARYNCKRCSEQYD